MIANFREWWRILRDAATATTQLPRFAQRQTAPLSDRDETRAGAHSPFRPRSQVLPHSLDPEIVTPIRGNCCFDSRRFAIVLLPLLRPGGSLRPRNSRKNPALPPARLWSPRPCACRPRESDHDRMAASSRSSGSVVPMKRRLKISPWANSSVYSRASRSLAVPPLDSPAL